MDLLILVFVLFLTYGVGSYLEKRHYRKIKKREKYLIGKIVTNSDFKNWPADSFKNLEPTLVSGEVVISGDYFKNFIARMQQIFGGRLTTFESIMDRARREAILRMRTSLPNIVAVVNVRTEAVMMNEQIGKIPKCAVIAYGTALVYSRK